MLNTRPSDVATPHTSIAAPAQLDGGTDYHPRAANSGTNYAWPTVQPYSQQQHHTQIPRHSQNAPPRPLPPPRQPAHAIGNAVSDLLPYCTTEPPLNEAQVIALSDVVGNLRELVVLALGAASGAAGCIEKLESAVGPRVAGNIAEFFANEWEIEG
jgi:hypothetical protein